MTEAGETARESGPAFGPAGLERRRAPRVPIAPGAPISVIGARLVNLSPYGMMIESPVSMERDAVLRLRLVVVRERIDVEARVVACWPVSGARKRLFGLGLEFIVFPEVARQRLREALATLG